MLQHRNEDRDPSKDARVFVDAAHTPDGQQIPEWEAAIYRAVSELRPGDMLLVAGRSHEETLVADGGARPLRDADAVADAMEGRVPGVVRLDGGG